MKFTKKLLSLLLCLIFLCGCSVNPPYCPPEQTDTPVIDGGGEGYFNYREVPAFDGKTPYAVINNNNPYFDKNSLTENSFESYGELDKLGRCTVVCANIGKDLMPTEERGSIGSVKPTGWQTVKYECVDGNYLYNRCHLIGYQLTGENANKNNLITGTRYLNVQGMLPFEDMVADYIKETSNHVLYKVSPIFVGDELVARGVLMEAYSVEDDGDGICFNVFCYNNQPEIEIDYLTGESKYVGASSDNKNENTALYVLNTSSKKFHLPSCSSVNSIKAENKQNYNGNRDSLIQDGYSPCGSCKP